MVLRAFDNSRNVVQMYHQIVPCRPDRRCCPYRTCGACCLACQGFDLAKDVYLQHQAFVASMPCTLVRRFGKKDLQLFGRPKTADNAVMTSPLIAEWKGNGHPVMTLFPRRGQIMTFDLFLDSTVATTTLPWRHFPIRQVGVRQ